VTNAWVSEADLPFVYLIAGIGCAGDGALAGGWSDSLGRRTYSPAAAIGTAVAALAMTTCRARPVRAMLVSMLLFAASSARMVRPGSDRSAAEPRLRAA